MVANSTYLKWRPGREELHLPKNVSKLLADRNGPVDLSEERVKIASSMTPRLHRAEAVRLDPETKVVEDVR